MLAVDGVPAALSRFEAWLRRLLGEPLVTRFAVGYVVDEIVAETPVPR